MEPEPVATVPDPARASAWRKGTRRRALAAATAGAAAVAITLVVVSSCKPRPIAGFGPTASVQRVAPWFPGCPLTRIVTEPMSVTSGSVWVTLPDEHRNVELLGACGCRFTSSRHITSRATALRSPDVVLVGWDAWPRADPVLRFLVAGEPLAIDNPGAATAMDTTTRPLVALPWSDEIDGWRYALSVRPGRVMRVRIDERAPIYPELVFSRTRAGSTAAAPGAQVTFHDALGNHRKWGVDGNLVSTLPVQSEGSWLLCPHTPWWEMSVAREGAEPFVVRFAPPR